MLRNKTHRSTRSLAALEHMRWLLSLLCAWAALATIGTAHAEGKSVDDLERSDQGKFRKLVDQCARAYGEDKFDRAEALCGEARALAPHPITLYTIARIRDRSNRCEEAVALYKEILDTPPPGPSERKWLDVEGEAVKKHFEYLGTCKPRVLATCSDTDGLVIVDAQVAGLCGQPLEVTAGQHAVTVVSTKRDPQTQTLNVAAGAPTPVTFKSLPPASPPNKAHQIPAVCEDFPQGAGLVVGQTVVGACPMTLDLAAGPHRVTALGPGGLRGAAQVNTDTPPPPPLLISPMQTLSVACDDPEVNIHFKVASLGEEVTGNCKALSEQPTPITLPRGDYEVTLTRLHYEPRTQPLKVTADNAPSLRAAPLEKSPVPFTLEAPPGVSGAQVKVGNQVSSLPLQTRLPEGTYSAEVRAEGHHPVTFPINLVHPGPQTLDTPPQEPIPFWTPGLITTLSGGALIATAFIYDMATLPRLNEFKTLAEEGSGDADLARYNELKPKVETDIVVTQALYGVGLGVAVAGGSWMLYEYLTRPPERFGGESGDAGAQTDTETTLSVTPMFAPTPDGSTTGLMLRWEY
jgi:hypothetical protein